MIIDPPSHMRTEAKSGSRGTDLSKNGPWKGEKATKMNLPMERKEEGDPVWYKAEAVWIPVV
jgi:hypothetical protein